MKIKVIIILSLIVLSFTASAVQVGPGDEFVSGDIIYGFDHTMNFSVISINADWILFNSTNFSVSPIHQLISSEQVTHGLAGSTDTLAHNADIISIVNVSQGATIYVVAVDYISTDNTIDWSPAGVEPAAGTTYNVWYWVNSTMRNTMQFMHENYSNASYSDSCLKFDSLFNSTGLNVWFNITGFETNENYTVFVDDVAYKVCPTGVGTTISFNYSSWSEHSFNIKNGKMSNTTLIRVQATERVTNVLSITNQVIAILGVVLIIAAILAIVKIVYLTEE